MAQNYRLDCKMCINLKRKISENDYIYWNTKLHDFVSCYLSNIVYLKDDLFWLRMYLCMSPKIVSKNSKVATLNIIKQKQSTDITGTE